MNTATLAVAGSRKTQSIVNSCSSGPLGRRRLVLNYTVSGQRSLEQRLRAACHPSCLPDVSGWYAFLLHHWVRPFLPLKYPGRRLTGLNFKDNPVATRNGIVVATGVNRFLDPDSRAYKRFLSKLAIDVDDAAEGTVITRLQRMYDEIYVDEVQDMTGYDLDVLERLLKSTSSIHLVGDIRQSVFDTNPQDRRLRKFRGLNMINWFKEQEKAGRLSLEFSSETWRSVQAVATFADTIFNPDFKFPPTISKQVESSSHDGIFAVAPADFAAYMRTFNPVCLRQRITTRIPDGVSAINFGVAKGLTYERVAIFPTAAMKEFLIKGTLLSDKSACGLYVGVTRAIHSVAFVMDNPDKTTCAVWSPGMP